MEVLNRQQMKCFTSLVVSKPGSPLIHVQAEGTSLFEVTQSLHNAINRSLLDAFVRIPLCDHTEGNVWDLKIGSDGADRYQADDNKKRPGGVWKSMGSYKTFYSQRNSLHTPPK